MAATTLVIACGALALELQELRKLNGLHTWELRYLPAHLHNSPEQIPRRVGELLQRWRHEFERVLVAYADCGTGGRLDQVLRIHGAERLPGAHCYEVLAGATRFAEIAQEEPGTFYLTDFLVRNFEPLVIAGLGLDRHPELLPAYFGNYRRVVYLSQSGDPALIAAARGHAERLGLAFCRHPTGLAPLARALAGISVARCHPTWSERSDRR